MATATSTPRTPDAAGESRRATGEAQRPPATPRFSEHHAARFIRHILDPSIGCSEVRLFGASFDNRSAAIVAGARYSRTLGGWYDKPDHLIADLKRISGVSAYITVNPVKPVMLARIDNNIGKLDRGQGTSDDNILCLRWAYIDIDRVKTPDAPDGISAAQDEIGEARARLDVILAACPEIASSAIWGCSGNGYWILVRLPDYPNDPEHNDLIARFLATLSARFSDDRAAIDVKTKNPSRVMCLPGTAKCKGSNREDRPWRLVTIESPEGHEPGVLELRGWLSQNEGLVEMAAQSKGGEGGGDSKGETNGHPAGTLNGHTNGQAGTPGGNPLVPRGPKDIIGRARKYIASFKPAIQGQGGSDQTFDAACALVKGFDLPPDVALSLLGEWNQTHCEPPWSEKELRHKIESADRKPDSKPRGYHLRDEKERPVANDDGTPTFEFSDQGNGRRLAHLFGHKILYCKKYGDWMIYDGRRWALDDRYTIEKMAQQISYQILAEMPPTKNEDTIKLFKQWSHATQATSKLEALLKAARSIVPATPDEFNRNPWLLNCLNGTIRLPVGEMRPHDSFDRITKIAPVRFDPEADCPTWRRFLLDIFEDDADLVAYVQRAVGYATTGVNREPAFFILYGTGRNGKTTFLNVIQAILGDYAAEVDSDLFVPRTQQNHPTGLTELEGRRFIATNETEENCQLDEPTVKKLTGKNPISARKMHQDYYTFLPTHHVFLATNHKPEVRGIDPAIWRRLKLIPFTACFDPEVPGGRKPDMELEDKLIAEAPGILNWMIEGCRAWAEHGLHEPPRVKAAVADYRRDSDILGWFLEEKTVCGAAAGPEPKVVFSVLYGDYKAWCGFNNINPIGIRRFANLLTDKGFKSHKSNSIVYRLGMRLKTPQELRDDESDRQREEQDSRLEPVDWANVGYG